MKLRRFATSDSSWCGYATRTIWHEYFVLCFLALIVLCVYLCKLKANLWIGRLAWMVLMSPLDHDRWPTPPASAGGHISLATQLDLWQSSTLTQVWTAHLRVRCRSKHACCEASWWKEKWKVILITNVLVHCGFHKFPLNHMTWAAFETLCFMRVDVLLSGVLHVSLQKQTKSHYQTW